MTEVRRGGLHLGIDASNIRLGGGVTHLSQLLAAGEPASEGIARVTVWACAATAAQLPERPWLRVISPAWAESFQLSCKSSDAMCCFPLGELCPGGARCPA